MIRRELREIWSNKDLRRSLIETLQAWNRALDSGEAAQRQAARMIGDLWVLLKAETAPRELPAMTVDRLLDFPSRRLAVYGSLAPGKKNHHMMAGMKGTWRSAVLRGSLRNEGWGAGEGFPGFRWDGSESPVEAQVFSSDDLPAHWHRLDEFEGEEYRRILVPVEVEGGKIEICNVYALAESLTSDEHD